MAWERKLAAVRCHASQIGPLQRSGAPDLLAPGGVLARERFWPWQIRPAGVILQE